MSNIGVIVPCRTASSRLPNKALVPLGGIPAIERCLANCLKIKTASRVILATTHEASDAALADHTLGGSVDLWRGDTEDVMQRFLGACDAYGLDTVVRITGDCPVASWEIAELLLQEHREHNAECTVANQFAVGASCDVFSVASLRRIHRHFGNAKYSEYMSWYFTKNPDRFHIRCVDLPPEWIRDYRLTLDYAEDVDMFNALYARMEEKGWPSDLDKVFAVLDADPAIPALNSSLPLKYRDDPELIRILIKAVTIKGEFK